MGYFSDKRKSAGNSAPAQEQIQSRETLTVPGNSCACEGNNDACMSLRHLPHSSGKSEQLVSPLMAVDFSNKSEEMVTERDFRMLQSMYPNAAKELLPYIEEVCDQLEYDGSAMFDEYPDFTTIDTLQKKVIRAAEKSNDNEAPDDRSLKNASSGRGADVCVPYVDLIRVLLLQEFHRRRERYRSCQE